MKNPKLNIVKCRTAEPVLLSTIIVALFSITAISGCTKPDENTATCSDGLQNQNETGVDCGGDCAACTASAFRIKTVTGSGTNETYTYDNKGRATTVVNGAGTSTYTYGTNTVTMVNSGGGGSTEYTLNSNGYIAVITFKDAAGNVTASYPLPYNSDSITHPSDVWTDDNCTFQGSIDNSTKTYLPGTVNTIAWQNKGLRFMGKDSKNLQHTWSPPGSSMVTYSYEYDSQNRVTKRTQTDGSTTLSLNYTYY